MKILSYNVRDLDGGEEEGDSQVCQGEKSLCVRHLRDEIEGVGG